MSLTPRAAEAKKKTLARYEYLVNDGLSIYESSYKLLTDKPDEFWEEQVRQVDKYRKTG